MYLPPLQVEGEGVKPCRYICRLVEQRCPYFHPSVKDQYAGERGQNGNSFQPTQEENAIMQIRNVYILELQYSRGGSMKRSNSASEVLRGESSSKCYGSSMSVK
ncbi:uncharacterized protein TNCV_958411 [Trichonephila clavipes]|nr:uncharacterized protein TNCV_958411 [Trichonephila clavipes]